MVIDRNDLRTALALEIDRRDDFNILVLKNFYCTSPTTSNSLPSSSSDSSEHGRQLP